MNMHQTEALRIPLAKILDWQDAHVNLDAAIEGIPPELRGVQPEGLPYSLWQLLEHMRLTQLDVLELARKEAIELTSEDPKLEKTQNINIKNVIKKRYPTYLVNVEAG